MMEQHYHNEIEMTTETNLLQVVKISLLQADTIASLRRLVKGGKV